MSARPSNRAAATARMARDFLQRARGLRGLSVKEGPFGREEVLYAAGDPAVTARAEFDADRFGYFVTMIESHYDAGRVLELGANPYILTHVLTNSGFDVVTAGHPSDSSTPERRENVTFTDTTGATAQTLPLFRFNVETETFPFPDESFDVVVCGELIEHLPRGPFQMLSECNRVLRTSGLLLVSTPSAVSFMIAIAMLRGRSLESGFSGQSLYGRHHRLYTLDELSELMNGNNFAVVDRTGISFPHDRSWYSPGALGFVKWRILMAVKAAVEMAVDRRDCIVVVGRKIGPATDFRPIRLFGGHDGIPMVAGQKPGAQGRGP